MPKPRHRVAVVGAGAAGLSAALEALRAGADVTVFERNSAPARKLRLLGRGLGAVGRPNADFSAYFGRHARFVQDALRAFDPAWFKRLKAPLEENEGEWRARQRGAALAGALVRALKRADLRLDCTVRGAERKDDGFVVSSDSGAETFSRAVLATGGAHAPQIADGASGLEIAKSLGHTVEDIHPALVGVRVAQYWPGRLCGLWMNVAATLLVGGREAAAGTGLVLFTRNSLTGPGLFALSREIQPALLEGAQVELLLNFYPEMSRDEVEHWLIATLGQHGRIDFTRAMDRMIPARLAAELLRLADIKPSARVDSISAQQRDALMRQLTGARLMVAATLGTRAALGMRGGVAVREVDPRSFESKRVPGLFIAGEMLAVDGSSLALNRQLAFGSGVLAGRAAVI